MPEKLRLQAIQRAAAGAGQCGRRRRELRCRHATACSAAAAPAHTPLPPPPPSPPQERNQLGQALLSGRLCAQVPHPVAPRRADQALPPPHRPDHGWVVHLADVPCWYRIVARTCIHRSACGRGWAARLHRPAAQQQASLPAAAVLTKPRATVLSTHPRPGCAPLLPHMQTWSMPARSRCPPFQPRLRSSLSRASTTVGFGC